MNMADTKSVPGCAVVDTCSRDETSNGHHLSQRQNGDSRPSASALRAGQVTRRFDISTRLAATPADVWARCTSVQGVARELSPWFRMTFPPGIEDLTPPNVELGKRSFRSWMLLFGVLPVDFDDVTFVDVEPGRRFVERSTMASQRVWVHERIVEPCDGGTLITDRLEWEGRLPGAELVFAAVVPQLFAWRHRQLKRSFDEA